MGWYAGEGRGKEERAIEEQRGQSRQGVMRVGEQGYVPAVWGQVHDHTNRQGESKHVAWQWRGADKAGARRGPVPRTEGN